MTDITTCECEFGDRSDCGLHKVVPCPGHQAIPEILETRPERAPSVAMEARS